MRGCGRSWRRDARIEGMAAELAVLRRLVFGRSSERVRQGAPGGGDGNQGPGVRQSRRQAARPGSAGGAAGLLASARAEVIWDFPGGGYCCPQCGEPFTRLGIMWQSSWTGR
jgi:hypothetical protein